MSLSSGLIAEKPSPPEEKESAAYDAILEIVSKFEKLDQDMPIQRLKIFLLAARYPGLNTQDLASKANIPKSSVSRNLSVLGDLNPVTKKEGYGLIQGKDLLNDRRNKIHLLTEKGRKLSNSIMRTLEEYSSTIS